MDSDGIEKRRAGKIEAGPVFRVSNINERPRLVSDPALFGADDRQIYDEFLDASNHQVPVEWLLQYDRGTACHDPQPGGRGRDGSDFPQFRSKNGAEIPRSYTNTRGSVGASPLGHNSLARVCSGALIPSGDWSLRFSGPFLGDTERISFRLGDRDRVRLDKFCWESRRVCGTFDGWVHESKEREYL